MHELPQSHCSDNWEGTLFAPIPLMAILYIYAVKAMSCNLYVPFLETCKSYGFCPAGLNLKKKLFIEFESDDLIIFWK